MLSSGKIFVVMNRVYNASSFSFIVSVWVTSTCFLNAELFLNVYGHMKHLTNGKSSIFLVAAAWNINMINYYGRLLMSIRKAKYGINKRISFDNVLFQVVPGLREHNGSRMIFVGDKLSFTNQGRRHSFFIFSLQLLSTSGRNAWQPVWFSLNLLMNQN